MPSLCYGRMARLGAAGILVCLGGLAAAAEGDPRQGVRAYTRECVPCHSLEPGRHMTGPSLSGIVGRKAGTAEGFDRYSAALRGSAIVWDEASLSAWLANTQAVVPGNLMTAAVADAKMRADIVAYLAATQSLQGERNTDIPKPYEKVVDLKSVGAASHIASIQYCRDTYRITLENGATTLFWENNLRFKTDSSKFGPPTGKPALVLSGQYGDRALAVFAAPDELMATIKSGC